MHTIVTEGRPTALGGPAVFPEGLPLVRPALPDRDDLLRSFARILDSGMLTNGPTVRAFEERVAAYLRVDHVVAVASCTSGLMLVLQAMGVSGRRVVLPSFTFSATAHAVHWAGGHPDFAEIDASHLTLDCADTGSRAHGAAAIVGTHVYGTPCDVEGLEAVSARTDAPILYDAAHALGSRHRGEPIGRFGTAEVFSLSPTKVTVAAEGGLVATNDEGLAEACRQGRDYGHPGDYDCRFPGLNARMSELHAAIGMASLADLDQRVQHRGLLVRRFRAGLEGLPGLSFPETPADATSTYKDLTIRVSSEEFGLSRDGLARALAIEGIDTRRYFDPPVHRQQAYRHGRLGSTLPVTDRVAGEVLTLPLWSHMDASMMERLALVVARIHRHSAQLRVALEA